MFVQMTLGATMIVATTVIEGAFTISGVSALRRHISARQRKSNIQSTLVLSGFVLWLFLATIFEIWTWAMLYLLLGIVTSLEEAVYFSTVNFTTLGYGDIILGPEWRLLASFEAANGLLLFGWSTALVFVAVQWVYEHNQKLPQHQAKEASRPRA